MYGTISFAFDLYLRIVMLQGTNPPLSPYFMNDETNGTRSWEYVQHPAPVPSRLAYEGGKTCIKVECTDNSEMDIRYAAYGSTNQHYYPVLMGECECWGFVC